MKSKRQSTLSEQAFTKQFRLPQIPKSIFFTLALIIGATSNIASANRFDPPSLKLELENFDSRIDGGIFNVDFLLAHIINNGRKTVREVGEFTDGAQAELQNTAVFTNNTGVNGPSAGSVIIPPGTSADTIIILNQNEGDSIAIQR